MYLRRRITISGTYDSKADDDNNRKHTNKPSYRIRPSRVNVSAVLQRLVFDPIKKEDEKQGCWCDDLPHPRPEETPDFAAGSYHLFHVVEKTIGSVNPSDEYALAYGDQQN